MFVVLDVSSILVILFVCIVQCFRCRNLLYPYFLCSMYPYRFSFYAVSVFGSGLIDCSEGSIVVLYFALVISSYRLYRLFIFISLIIARFYVAHVRIHVQGTRS